MMYLLSFIIPISAIIAFTSNGVMTYFTVIVSFIIIPVFELLIPTDSRNLNQEQENKYKLKSSFFNSLLKLMVAFQYILLFIFCRTISHEAHSIFEFIGLTFSMGVCCGVLGINVAHELGHRNNSFEQFLAKLLLSTSWYTHFFVEHNKGHHKFVSTPRDPATARMNQTVYHFWFQSIVGSLKSALEIEKKKTFFQNQVYKWKLIELTLTLIILFIFGFKAMIAFLLAAVIGIILLESVNYVEHYGLVRKELAPNRFEKVTPAHSWNSDHPLGRLILFNLSRHSDHHANASRPYQLLRSFNESSPQFPTGYPGMILLSLIPSIWFKVMNPRATAWNSN